MLGDGALRYATEHVGECYYSFSMTSEHITVTGAYQVVVNPGYNRDRGPADVLGLRLHAEI